MPLPFSVLTMESIAITVQKWQKSEISATEAIEQIGKKVTDFQAIAKFFTQAEAEE